MEMESMRDSPLIDYYEIDGTIYDIFPGFDEFDYETNQTVSTTWCLVIPPEVRERLKEMGETPNSFQGAIVEQERRLREK